MSTDIIAIGERIEMNQTMQNGNSFCDKVDLTETDSDDEDEVVVVRPTEDNNKDEPKAMFLNKDIYKHFYCTEDISQIYRGFKYFGIQQKPENENSNNETQISIICPKCNLRFINHTFIHHLMDHYTMEYGLLDTLLLPKSCDVDCSFVNDYYKVSHSTSTNLRCEICLIDFSTAIELSQHLQKRHSPRDMPYVCRICNLFRTSFHSQLMRHFAQNHFSTNTILCPLCNLTFILPFKSLDQSDCHELDPIQFLYHLEKHICKKQFYCDKCVLRFISKQTLMFHRTVQHSTITDNIDNNRPVVVVNSSNSNSTPSILKKSLNVGFEPVDLSKMRIGTYKLHHVCVECRESLVDFSKHYDQYLVCSKCGYTTRCAVQFRRHSHSRGLGQIADLTLDLCRDHYLICPCSYQTLHGNLMAQHLLSCNYNINKNCYVKPRLLIASTNCNDKTKMTNKNKFCSYLQLKKKS